jgi:hypothetical protein
MKYLFSLLLVGMSFITIAQNRDGSMRGNYNMMGNNSFTPEQYAELQTKRLTLALELTSAQQKQILEMNKKRAVEAIFLKVRTLTLFRLCSISFLFLPEFTAVFYTP